MNQIITQPKSRASRTGIFSRHESNVRSYARNFPVVFSRAEDVRIFDEQGNAYLDFLAGAGSLNYGHNHPALKSALIEYIQRNGITLSLDLHTSAKADFLEKLDSRILKPRGLDYLTQFTGPTGTNAVEAALKLARKVTGRQPIISFTNGFHGVTLGALAATGNQHHRGTSTSLEGVIRMPYDGYLGEGVNTLDYLEKTLLDNSSGIDKPAAVILETVQGEGGLNVGSMTWLKQLEELCKRNDILLIVDDIQAGCGRTGTFFSFEPAGIKPDIITLSKSLSGMGLPLAVVLIRPDLDAWLPGEHNGTFRGNNHAFVTAARALDLFWSDDKFALSVQHKANMITRALTTICAQYPDQLRVKGRGLMQGISFEEHHLANAASHAAFDRGMIIETSGPFDEVLKCLCPLIISEDDLLLGLSIIEESINHVLNGAATGRKKERRA